MRNLSNPPPPLIWPSMALSNHLFFWTGASYVVPYVDEQGRISGLQVKEIGGKYLTARGAKATEMYHVAGRRHGITDLFVTEGGLKSRGLGPVGGRRRFWRTGPVTLGHAHRRHQAIAANARHRRSGPRRQPEHSSRESALAQGA